MDSQIENLVSAAIDHLHYDFSQFTIDHFAAYLAEKRRRPIDIHGFPFQPDLFGVWIRAGQADYIFYTLETHPIHQNHIVLHELGHLVLGHAGQSISDVLPAAMLRSLGPSASGRVYGRFRKVNPESHLDEGGNAEEVQAEEFVHQMQWKIMLAKRLDHLTQHASSIEALERFTRGLGYD